MVHQLKDRGLFSTKSVYLASSEGKAECTVYEKAFRVYGYERGEILGFGFSSNCKVTVPHSLTVHIRSDFPPPSYIDNFL